MDRPELITERFRLNRSSWGRGIAKEACARLLAHGFDDLGIDRIVGVAMAENVPSVRVLEKTGLRFERFLHMDGALWTNYALSRVDLVRRRLTP
ncbi:MAG: GNAT family N-acetyltransferase [Bryobacterales bacterium]|nr:GNAT family N-acetyltransferase [Bryobacterales bacterium]